MRTKKRQLCWDTTEGRCFYCGQPLLPDGHDLQEGLDQLVDANEIRSRGVVLKTAMEVDHKTPPSLGGSDLQGNLAPACVECNAQKHKKTVQEYQHYLIANGLAPRFFSTVTSPRNWLFVATVPRHAGMRAAHRRFTINPY